MDVWIPAIASIIGIVVSMSVITRFYIDPKIDGILNKMDAMYTKKESDQLFTQKETCKINHHYSDRNLNEMKFDIKELKSDIKNMLTTFARYFGLDRSKEG